MAMNTYSCECGFKEEYIESFSVEKCNWHPEICPKCGEKPLTKIFDMTNSKGGFDIVGFCYANTMGKKNWKRNMSQGDQAKVLNGEKDPY